MPKTKLSTVIAIVFAPQLASAMEFTLADLVISHPFAYETPVSAMAGGGYLSVTNTGTMPDRLIGVRADFPRVSFHESKETDGIMGMEPVDAIDIPAGETVALTPGGTHLMFMGLRGRPFEVDDEIPVTLIFEHAGKIDVIMRVEPRAIAD